MSLSTASYLVQVGMGFNLLVVLIALISPFSGGKLVIFCCFFNVLTSVCVVTVASSMLVVSIVSVALMVNIIAVPLEGLFKCSLLRWRTECVFSNFSRRDLRKYKPVRE